MQHYEHDQKQVQYQRKTTNLKSSLGNFFEKNPQKNNNANYKEKIKKMNLNKSRNKNDAK